MLSLRSMLVNNIDKNEIRKPYQVVIEGGEGEYVEKKSRFIATVQPVESEEEAVAFIEGIKKKYWDARHNCSAFVIGSKNEITRCSDDGEPSGTAGRPMLEVLLGQEVHNVAVVVTRYFGGILLGTGGLVRAYSDATIQAIEKTEKINICPGFEYKVKVQYSEIENIKYYCRKNQINIVKVEYLDDVECYIEVKEEFKEKLLESIKQKEINVIEYQSIGDKLVKIDNLE